MPTSQPRRRAARLARAVDCSCYHCGGNTALLWRLALIERALLLERAIALESVDTINMNTKGSLAIEHEIAELRAQARRRGKR